MSLDRIVKKSGQINVGIDIDNTLIRIPLIEAVNMKFGTSYTYSDLSDFSLSNFPDDVRDYMFDLHLDPDFMCKYAKPFDGTRDVLLKWKTKGYKLFAITKRDLSLKNATIQQFDEQFYGLFSDMEFVPTGRSKGDALKRFLIDVYADDYEVDDSLSLGIKTFLITNEFTRYNWHKRENLKLNQAAFIRHVHPETY